MKKLLVNAPSGAQQVAEVGEGGGYFDASRVLWDERADGELPSITLGGMVRSGNSLTFSQSRMDEHTAATRRVPAEVTMRQARLALASVGLLDAVDEAIAEISNPAQKNAAEIEWEFSSTVRRNQPLVLALAPALGLDEAALDQLFIGADAL